MSIFKKKKVAEVKNEVPQMRKIEIEVKCQPLVKIEKHEHRVDGKMIQEPQYCVSIRGRDVLTISAREYDELFMEMLRRKNPSDLIHDISEAHMELHDGTKAEIPDGLKEAIEQAFKQAEELA